MFKNVTSFSFQRNAVQALGWYLIFLILEIFIFAILGFLAGQIFYGNGGSFSAGFSRGFKNGVIEAVIMQIFLGILLVVARPKSFLNIFLILLAAVFSVFSGALGGLVPLAVLTTRSSNLSPNQY